MSDFEVLPIGTKAMLELLEGRVSALVEHLNAHITFAQDRIQDGIKCGATVWRLALEDIARENAVALDKAGHPRPATATPLEKAAA